MYPPITFAHLVIIVFLKFTSINISIDRPLNRKESAMPEQKLAKWFSLVALDVFLRLASVVTPTDNMPFGVSMI